MKTIKRSLLLGIDLEMLDESMLLGCGIFTIGRYFPKYHYGHRESSWSQLLMTAKRYDRRIISMLGKYVAEHLNCLLNDRKTYVLTYVPGKNHLPQMLASEIVVNIHNPKQLILEDLLMVVNKTRHSQHRCKSIGERFSNISGCYSLSDEVDVIGKNIVLIDDIITTGATIGECAMVLRNAGAKSVAKFALARTVRK